MGKSKQKTTQYVEWYIYNIRWLCGEEAADTKKEQTSMNACLIMCGSCLDFFVAEWTLAPSLGVCECSARTLCSSWNGSAADSCWCPSQFGGLLHNRTDQEHQQCYSWSSGPDHPFSSRGKKGSAAEGNVVASCTFPSLKLQNERSNECLVPSMIFKLINNWCKVMCILYLTALKFQT